MSAQEATGSESQRLEALAKQLADLERQATEMSDAFQRSASVRRLLILVVVAVLAVYLYLFYTAGKSFFGEENRNKLLGELRARAAGQNSEELMHQARLLVENTWPAVSEAMAKQFQADMPVIMNLLGTERDNLAVNLQSRLDSVVQAQYRKALDQHRAILKEVSSAEDDEAISAMIGNLEDAFTPLVKRYYGNRIKGEFERMYKIWDDFPLDDSKRNRDELSQELYHLLFALMQQKLAKAGAEEPGTKPAPKASGS